MHKQYIECTAAPYITSAVCENAEGASPTNNRQTENIQHDEERLKYQPVATDHCI